jgi:hypothetical protein
MGLPTAHFSARITVEAPPEKFGGWVVAIPGAALAGVVVGSAAGPPGAV